MLQGREENRRPGRERAHGEEEGLLGGEALHLAGVAGGGPPLERLRRGPAVAPGGAAWGEVQPASTAAAEGRQQRRGGGGERRGCSGGGHAGRGEFAGGEQRGEELEMSSLLSRCRERYSELLEAAV